MNQHVAVDAAMESAAEEIASNVVDLAPETELERHARLHRGIIEQQEKRAAEALHDGKSAANVFKQERKHSREKYQAEVAAIRQLEASHKADTLATIAVAERLAAASRAALECLEG